MTKEIIQALIDKGSDVNHRCEYGDNFLLNLCYNRKLTVDLLESGLSLEFKVTDNSRIGYTPLYIVSQVACPNFNELFHYLVKQGADVNAMNIHGQTPLYTYCQSHPITQKPMKQYIDAQEPKAPGWKL